MKSICGALVQNSTLTSLAANECAFGSKGYQRLAKALLENSTLSKLEANQSAMGNQLFCLLACYLSFWLKHSLSLYLSLFCFERCVHTQTSKINQTSQSRVRRTSLKL